MYIISLDNKFLSIGRGKGFVDEYPEAKLFDTFDLAVFGFELLEVGYAAHLIGALKLIRDYGLDSEEVLMQTIL